MGVISQGVFPPPGGESGRILRLTRGGIKDAVMTFLFIL